MIPSDSPRFLLFPAVAFLLPGILFAAPAARVCVEAETAAVIEEPFYKVTADAVPDGTSFVKGASGDSYLEIPEGRGNPPKVETGRAELVVDVPRDGAYLLWARVWWEGECGNSLRIQVDGGAPFLFGEDGTFQSWHWVKYPVARTAKPLQLKKGPCTLVFLNNEDGVRIDQVVLCADRRWVPVDIEPVTAP
ncbi:MAG: hypothetical protein ACOX5G_09580 [Kiritimatiellia bacterium]|jgi:hypothetical protein